MTLKNTDNTTSGFVSVIVPVFNEVNNIIDNIDLLIAEIEEYFTEFEILVVSDGSTDGTNSTVIRFRHPNMRLLVSEQNKGKGYAVRMGLKEAKGDYIFFIDGGMELHPKELRIFFELMRLYGADIVIGSKRHPQSQVIYPWYRRLLSLIFQIFIRILFKIKVTDTQVGIKLLRREVVLAILPDLQIDRYGFDLEILSLAQINGFTNILEAPIRMDYFLKNRRFIIFEIAHVFRIALNLLSDTMILFIRLQRLKRAKLK